LPSSTGPNSARRQDNEKQDRGALVLLFTSRSARGSGLRVVCSRTPALLFLQGIYRCGFLRCVRLPAANRTIRCECGKFSGPKNKMRPLRRPLTRGLRPGFSVPCTTVLSDNWSARDQHPESCLERRARKRLHARLRCAAPACLWRMDPARHLLKRWLYGPEEWPLAVCDIDLTIGGEARFVWRHRDGKDVGMSGVYRVRDRLDADPFLAGATFTLAISASAPRSESGAAHSVRHCRPKSSLIRSERMAARPAFQRAHQAQRPPQQTSIRR